MDGPRSLASRPVPHLLGPLVSPKSPSVMTSRSSTTAAGRLPLRSAAFSAGCQCSIVRTGTPLGDDWQPLTGCEMQQPKQSSTRSAELWPASEAEAQQMRRRLQLTVPAYVIPPGVDVPPSHLEETSVDVRKSLGIPPDALIAIVIGAASVFKGTDNALRTVSSARHLSDRDVRLVVVGADSGEVERMADAAGIADWPAFLIAVGRVSDQRKSELLVASDVLLMLSQYEAFGFVALEALAHGCSVIAFDDFPSSSSLAAWGAARVRRSDSAITIARCLLGAGKTTRPSLPTWEQFGDQCLERLLAHAKRIGV